MNRTGAEIVTAVVILVVLSPAFGLFFGFGWRAFRWAAGW